MSFLNDVTEEPQPAPSNVPVFQVLSEFLPEQQAIIRVRVNGKTISGHQIPTDRLEEVGCLLMDVLTGIRRQMLTVPFGSANNPNGAGMVREDTPDPGMGTPLDQKKAVMDLASLRAAGLVFDLPPGVDLGDLAKAQIQDMASLQAAGMVEEGETGKHPELGPEA